MNYTKLSSYNESYCNCNEKTKESGSVSPMITISSFSPDAAVISKSFPYPSLRRIGTIKLLILTIVTPIMILTIVNPMWICVFMKYPHLHHTTKTPVSVEMPHASNNVHHTDNLSYAKPHHTHTHTKSYKGGIKVTQETIDVIVASKDGHRLEELETTITVIENVPPRTKNHRNRKQISQHDTKKGFRAHAHAHVSVAAQVKNHNESITDKIRERLFRNRNSCAYVALSVITLCAVTICGVVCLSSDKKAYESINNEEENRLIDDHYVQVEDCEDDEKLSENNVTENKTDACVIDCTRVQVNDNNISTPTSSPPPYSPNTNYEPISTSENTQQSTNEN